MLCPAQVPLRRPRRFSRRRSPSIRWMVPAAVPSSTQCSAAASMGSRRSSSEKAESTSSTRRADHLCTRRASWVTRPWFNACSTPVQTQISPAAEAACGPWCSRRKTLTARGRQTQPGRAWRKRALVCRCVLPLRTISFCKESWTTTQTSTQLLAPWAGRPCTCARLSATNKVQPCFSRGVLPHLSWTPKGTWRPRSQSGQATKRCWHGSRTLQRWSQEQQVRLQSSLSVATACARLCHLSMHILSRTHLPRSKSRWQLSSRSGKSGAPMVHCWTVSLDPWCTMHSSVINGAYAGKPSP
mmetsp:Transcript_118089/g.208805  ORF Transcript_118089/g.208805 Transcript_118089/m.208805 type:complete len:299 (+) Transcript_118089:267-1163(+)